MSHWLEDRRECHRFQFTHSFLSMNTLRWSSVFHPSSLLVHLLGASFNLLRSFLCCTNKGICLCREAEPKSLALHHEQWAPTCLFSSSSHLDLMCCAAWLFPPHTHPDCCFTRALNSCYSFPKNMIVFVSKVPILTFITNIKHRGWEEAAISPCFPFKEWIEDMRNIHTSQAGGGEPPAVG